MAIFAGGDQLLALFDDQVFGNICQRIRAEFAFPPIQIHLNGGGAFGVAGFLVIEITLDKICDGVFLRLRGLDTDPKGRWTA